MKEIPRGKKKKRQPKWRMISTLPEASLAADEFTVDSFRDLCLNMCQGTGYVEMVTIDNDKPSNSCVVKNNRNRGKNLLPAPADNKYIVTKRNK